MEQATTPVSVCAVYVREGGGGSVRRVYSAIGCGRAVAGCLQTRALSGQCSRPSTNFASSRLSYTVLHRCLCSVVTHVPVSRACPRRVAYISYMYQLSSTASIIGRPRARGCRLQATRLAACILAENARFSDVRSGARGSAVYGTSIYLDGAHKWA